MTSMKVLLVEDDVVSLRVLANALRQQDFSVLPAVDAESALRTLEWATPDVMVTDLRLPGMSGLDLMRQVRRRDPQVQFIVITAYGDAEVALEALRLGALDYLKKPIDLDQLVTALQRGKKAVAHDQHSAEVPTLLLAEDDAVARRSLASILQREGYHVKQAADGQEALAIFRATKIDIAIFDVRMPNLDGLSALHMARSINNDFEAIVLTAWCDETSVVQALREGALGFLRKPVELEELLGLVKQAVLKLSRDRGLHSDG
jgi:DNA-binding NtrC family response regulator